ncbi:glucokinase [Mucilaginibacter gracilis]|uniref:Glucokinase n=2 Tax=Mucilaginibacter gracilis TaxID=423350 RepID=A0A495J6Z6_9SPHI|nr:glucokinase [Mucilaginibacter gracilis]
MKQEDLILGIDIGGSHITVGFVDLNTREIVQKSYFRAFINSWGEATDIIAAWTAIIEQAFATVNITEKKIGIAMPGPFDYEAGISYIKGNKKYDSLYGLNIKQLLAQRLNIPTANILMFNDAECFLKGEVFAGAALNSKKAIALTLGTGLGTAVYNNGVAADGELWNSPMMDGIAEDYISTRWFLKEYFDRTGINIANVKALNDICGVSGVARAVFKLFAENLAVFLESFIEKEHPDVIVIGGNITKASLRFMPHLLSCLNKKDIHIPIEITELGELAPLFGAASYWVNNTYHLQDTE